MRDHTGDKRFSCIICDETFATADQWKTHYQTHSINKPHSCEICERSYQGKKGLSFHKGNHKFTQFACQFCDRQFLLQSLFKNHERKHTGDKPFTCLTCGAKFRSTTFLGRHTKIKHTIIGQIDKPHICPECDKCFREKHGLKMHLLTHSNVKALSCDICNMKFATKSSLWNHSRKHLDQRPFPCEMCSKGYYSRSQLMNHMHVHTGEKRFACPYCESKFTAISSKLKHVRKFHIED